METEEPGLDPRVQYLDYRSHGKNLCSTSGQAERIAKYFFKAWTTGWTVAPCEVRVFSHGGYKEMSSILAG